MTMTQTKLADQTVINAAEASLEDVVIGAVNDGMDCTNVHKVDNGIGPYEFWGARYNDVRIEFEMDSFTLAVDVTALAAHEQEWNENIKGHNNYSPDGENEVEVNWCAKFTKKVEENGKVFLIFEVTQT